MQRVGLAAVVLCAACRFHVGPLGDVSPGAIASDLGSAGTANSVDLATADAPDLASGGADLALAAPDLATPSPADMTSDPCAQPPPLAAGAIAAQCVVGAAPKIDGDLSDWPGASFLAMTKATAAQAEGTWDVSGVPNDANSSARFYLRWDLDYLYVAAAVTDDTLSTPNSTYLTNNDALELFVDGQHDRTASYGTDDWQLIYSADKKKEAAQDGNLVTFPMGVQQAWKNGSGAAWTFEAAVPWSLLGGAPATLGRVVGFDLKLDDNDSGTTRQRDLVLYYTAPANGACTAPYCRTDAFGAVQLQGR